ncbi:MAG: heavy-metal-associated domain-containing protein [Clostridiales bacterium]|nr:heavy-metal-associated domain-containing protein [Clostridiales bacterium]
MLLVTMKIDGMACTMCESHIKDKIRNSYPEAKKIKASYKSGEVSFVIDGNVDEKSIEAKIEETGYKVINYNEEPYEKKPFWKR